MKRRGSETGGTTVGEGPIVILAVLRVKRRPVELVVSRVMFMNKDAGSIAIFPLLLKKAIPKTDLTITFSPKLAGPELVGRGTLD